MKTGTGTTVRAAVLILVVGIAAFHAVRTLAGEPPLHVGVNRIDLAEVPEEQRKLSWVMNDILAQAIEQSLAEERGYYVWVSRTELEGGEEELAGRAEMLREEGLRFLVLPTLVYSDEGYALRILTFDLEPREDAPPARQVGLDVAVMGPDADFAEIETRLRDVATRLTYRMSGKSSPGGKILLWCITPADSEDPELFTATRRLTLELPYYLSATPQLTDHYTVAGLNPRAFYADCQSRERQSRQQAAALDRLPLERHDFTIFGESSREPGGPLHIILSVESPAKRFPIPLTTLDVPLDFNDGQLQEAAEIIAQSLVERVESGELSVIPMR